MARIIGKIAFGTRVAITVPLPLPEEAVAAVVSRAEAVLQAAFKLAIEKSLATLGVKVQFFDSAVKIEPEKIEP